MDARRQKQLMKQWMARLIVAIALATTCEAQADSTKACTRWPARGNQFFTTPLEAAQVIVDDITAYVANWNATHPYGIDHHVYVFLGCNGYIFDNGFLEEAYCSYRMDYSDYGLYWIGGTFSLNLQCHYLKNLTISLSGGTEVEPSNGPTINTLPFIATVKQSDGHPPTNPVDVKISLRVDSTSGGHDHGTSDRPRGGIADLEKCSSDDVCKTMQTDGNGQAVFNFNPTEASGTHTISVTCEGCGNTDSKSVDVKVKDLWPIAASTYYTFIGSTTEHSSNHYVASAAQQKLWKLAQNFYDYQVLKGVPQPVLLHLNDASLKWGGLFDKDGDWDVPHKEHRRGTVVDVRANTSPGAIPPEYFDAYMDMANKLGIDPHPERIGDPVNQHFHTRLLNRKE